MEGSYSNDEHALGMAHAQRIGCYMCHMYEHTAVDDGLHFDNEVERRWIAGQRRRGF